MLKKTVIRYSLGLFFLSSLHDMGDIFYFFEDNSTHTKSQVPLLCLHNMCIILLIITANQKPDVFCAFRSVPINYIHMSSH